MPLPNYHDGSIVNLMSSILRAFGGTSPYLPLPALPPEEVAEYRHVILLVIDGLGYEYLVRQTHDTRLQAHVRASLTSVFPSTTAACITTFLSGVAPQQHTMTGWFMHLKEVGAVTTVLPFQPRCCNHSLRSETLRPEALFPYQSIFAQIDRQSYFLHPRTLAKSAYRPIHGQHAQECFYTTLNGCLRHLKRINTTQQNPAFTYAYWGYFDYLCHRYGTTSPHVSEHFSEIVNTITSWFHTLPAHGTLLLITADHGFIDTPASHVIRVAYHHPIRDALVLPLCGDRRVAYCYVRPAKVRQFEEYVTHEFAHACDLYRSEELIRKQYFGLFEPDPRLFDRVGDYTLIMRDDYAIHDLLAGEDEKTHIGNHGGISRDEMFVPLLVMKHDSP